LLTGVPVCYKPYMRKWMSEKLKRRKKTPEETAAQPAPLQPAFYDTAPPENPPATKAIPKSEPEAPQAARETDSAMQSGETASAPQPAGDARRPRRRRGRGGRGRRSSGQRPAVPVMAGEASLAAPIAVAAPAPQRPPKGVVVLAVGLPGSGKSSWFKRHNITPLSSDMLRSLLFDDPAEQRFQDLVFSNLRSMLKARLIAHRPLNYVDATNLTPQERQNWIKLAKDFGYEVQAVFFDVPLDVCIERHQRRDRLVPEDVMRKMSAKLKAPTFDEGFSKITVVRVKQQKPE
jgi:predicted kinase